MIKFILIDRGSGDDLPVLFPALEKHSDFAAEFAHDVVEAGFVRVNGEGKLIPYGESISLGVECGERSIAAFKALNSESY